MLFGQVNAAVGQDLQDTLFPMALPPHSKVFLDVELEEDDVAVADEYRKYG
jgi:hypothetical protein